MQYISSCIKIEKTHKKWTPKKHTTRWTSRRYNSYNYLNTILSEPFGNTTQVSKGMRLDTYKDDIYITTTNDNSPPSL